MATVHLSGVPVVVYTRRIGLGACHSYGELPHLMFYQDAIRSYRASHHKPYSYLVVRVREYKRRNKHFKCDAIRRLSSRCTSLPEILERGHFPGYDCLALGLSTLSLKILVHPKTP